LLLTAVDQRIKNTVSIVPPFVGDKVALVAPINLVDKLQHQRVLLITASDDENSNNEQNEYLYQSIGSLEKKQIDFESGHILPKRYINDVADWL